MKSLDARGKVLLGAMLLLVSAWIVFASPLPALRAQGVAALITTPTPITWNFTLQPGQGINVKCSTSETVVGGGPIPAQVFCLAPTATATPAATNTPAPLPTDTPSGVQPTASPTAPLSVQAQDTGSGANVPVTWLGIQVERAGFPVANEAITIERCLTNGPVCTLTQAPPHGAATSDDSGIVWLVVLPDYVYRISDGTTQSVFYIAPVTAYQWQELDLK